MNIKKGQIINVQAYKANGVLYRQWNGVIVFDVKEHEVVLLMYKTKVAEKNKTKWTIYEPIFWFMPIHKFYNTTAFMRGNGTYFYTNLASPPFNEDNTIKYIDYDLDIKAYPRQKVKIVDQKEFKDHTIKYNYSNKLLQVIDQNLEEAMENIAQNKHIYQKGYIRNMIKMAIENKLLPKNIWKRKTPKK